MRGSEIADVAWPEWRPLQERPGVLRLAPLA
jgi:hypothetical protein